nr:hypothetical protein [Microcoleus sp. CAWBG52]
MATSTFSPTCLKLVCHEVLSRLALLWASSIAQEARSTDTFKRWLLMNMSQEGLAIAQNIPSIAIIINVSSIVKPALGAVALRLGVLFIDT